MKKQFTHEVLSHRVCVKCSKPIKKRLEDTDRLCYQCHVNAQRKQNHPMCSGKEARRLTHMGLMRSGPTSSHGKRHPKE